MISNNQLFRLLLIGVMLVPGITTAKPRMIEGVASLASSRFPDPVTHILREKPKGRILVAIIDDKNLLHGRTDQRITMVGELASNEAQNDIPVMYINRVMPASWVMPNIADFQGSPEDWRGSGGYMHTREEDRYLPMSPFTKDNLIPPDFWSDFENVEGWLDGWTGLIHFGSEEWVYHWKYGWLKLRYDSANSAYFFSPSISWMFSSREAQGHFYWYSEDTWLEL
ncbi:MAG: hypothetical protein AB3N63_13775 [Puniceicoccaceae bacterium]